MVLGYSRIFFLSLFVAIISSFSGGSAAQNHTAFMPVPLPSQHLLESSVHFGQDAQGQVWFVTAAGLSVYRDEQFHSFRSFNFGMPIISAAILGRYALLATHAAVYQVGLSNPDLPLVVLWRAKPKLAKPDTEQVSLLLAPRTATNRGARQGRGAVYLQTNLGIYELALNRGSGPGQAISESKLLQSFESSTPLSTVMVSKGLLTLDGALLSFFAFDESSWQSVRLPQAAKAVAEFEGILYFISDQGSVFKGDPFSWTDSSRFEQIPNSPQAQHLLSGEHTLLAQSGSQIWDMGNLNVTARVPNLSGHSFVDVHNNIWLSTEYDIQVAWWQPIASLAHASQPWHQTFSRAQMDQTTLFAFSGQTLMHRKRKAPEGRQNESWWPVYRHEKQGDEIIRILSTDQHVWLQTQTELVALDKSTWTVNHQMVLPDNALVLPYNRNQLLLFSDSQVQSVSGFGRVAIEKYQSQCEMSCLPNYKITAFTQGQTVIWLATNQGLQALSLDNLEFSDSRLDALNQVSPIIAVHPASEDKLWLVYPNRVAAFDTKEGTSQFFYSQKVRIFDAHYLISGELAINTQEGWRRLVLPEAGYKSGDASFVLQQLVFELDRQVTRDIDGELVLTSDDSELQLAFNLGKQHPAQSLMVRFKYLDEADWTQVPTFGPSLTLKNLRQGSNQLLLQMRLEGQRWQHAKTIHYILPYRFFQTKWVIVFVAAFLLALLGIVLHERLNRVQVMFKAIKQQAFISSLLESTREGVWVANQDREIQSVNQSFTEITGFRSEEVEGASFKLSTDFGRNHEVESLIWQEVMKSGYWSGEVWSKNAKGEKISIDLSVTRVASEEPMLGKVDVKFVGVFSDVTERKKSERDLRQLATRDSLTNLANRTLFIEHIKHSIETISSANPHFAIMFLDLDNFKKVNESLGPLKGDEFIKQVAERLVNCVPKGVSVARLGGDEFALLISSHLFSGVPAFYIKRVATDIQREMQPAFYLDRTEISITASMGVAIFPNHGDVPELLMRCADTALNRVKITGRNNCLVYDHVMDDMVNDKLSLESELLTALHNDEFIVYYQPKYKIQQNQVCGFEALIRWQNPHRGLVPPEQFIKIAEDNGLIRQLDTWVLRQVCRQIKDWLKADAMKGKIAVNISSLNFQQAEFCDSVLAIIAEEGELIPYIELEITESAIMREPDRALESIKTLRSKGFSIALDDFGTGHSSLGYLKRFPIDRIKMDRVFVKDIEYAAQDRNIASVIVQLAKHLGIEVIAEGVESEMQAYLLHVMGCNEIQGYLVSRPIIAEQVEHFLNVDARKLQQIAHANET